MSKKKQGDNIIVPIIFGLIVIPLFWFVLSSTANSGDQYVLENVTYVHAEPATDTTSLVFGVFEEFDGTQHKLYMDESKTRELKNGNKYNVVYLMNHKAFPYDYIMTEAIPTGSKKVEDKR